MVCQIAVNACTGQDTLCLLQRRQFAVIDVFGVFVVGFKFESFANFEPAVLQQVDLG
jgi:hypothetical protein